MQIRKKESLSTRALGETMTSSHKHNTEKMLHGKSEVKRFDKKAIKGMLWKNLANRIGDKLHSKHEISGPSD